MTTHNSHKKNTLKLTDHHIVFALLRCVAVSSKSAAAQGSITRSQFNRGEIRGATQAWSLSLTFVLQEAARFTYTNETARQLNFHLRRRHARRSRSACGRQARPCLFSVFFRHHVRKENPMKNVSRIAAITLASSLALLATGCDRKPADQTAGETVDHAVAETKQDTHELGNTLERKADQAGQAIDDTAITTSIKAKYLADDTLKGLDISVETEHGVVTLTGSVQNDAAKSLATTIAQGVDGVASVNNQLSIQ
jgi:hyperosmotically inducible periplasmic protein